MSKNGYQVTYQNGMLNIDADEFGFGLIEHMYTTGHGISLQLGVVAEGHDKEIEDACMEVHRAMKNLEKIMSSLREKER